MAAKINGKTFRLQRSLKPLAFSVENSNKFKFKLTQFGIPIANISPIAEKRESERQQKEIDLLYKKMSTHHPNDRSLNQQDSKFRFRYIY